MEFFKGIIDTFLWRNNDSRFLMVNKSQIEIKILNTLREITPTNLTRIV